MKINVNENRKKLYIDIVIIVACAFFSFKLLNDVMAPYFQAKEENKQLQTSIEEASETKKELENSLEQSKNSEDIEKSYMRERFHLSEEDELIFVFPE